MRRASSRQVPSVTINRVLRSIRAEELLAAARFVADELDLGPHAGIDGEPQHAGLVVGLDPLAVDLGVEVSRLAQPRPQEPLALRAAPRDECGSPTMLRSACSSSSRGTPVSPLTTTAATITGWPSSMVKRRSTWPGRFVCGAA